MIEIIAYVVFLLLTFIIGRRFLIFLKVKLAPLEEFLLSYAIGAGFLIYFTMFLGFAGLIYPVPYLLLAVFAIAFFYKDGAYLISLFILLLKSIASGLRFSMRGTLLFAYIFFIFATAIPIFTPISEFDSAAYHVAFAKVYAAEHSIVYQPTQLYSVMPQAMTMLYTLSELLALPKLSSFIAYSFGVSASLALYALAAGRYSKTAGLMASLIFFTIPSVIERLPQTMVDLSLTYFFLAALIVMLKYVAETDAGKRFSFLIVFSIMIGMVNSVKLSGLFVSLAFFVGLVAFELLKRKKLNLVHLAVFGFVVLLFLSPWLVRSYVHTGNPVYPQAAGIFGGIYLDTSLNSAYSSYHDSIGLGRNLLNVLLVYWHLTFNTKFGTVIGVTPFFIMAIPLIFFFYNGVRKLELWVIAFLMSTIIAVSIFLVNPVLRYLFPALALLSFLSAVIFDVAMRHKLLKVVIFLMLAASLSFSAAILYGINAKNISYILLQESESDYYNKLNDKNPYAAESWINSNTPPGSVILLFNEPRGYFLDRPYIISSQFQNFIDYGGMNGSSDLLGRLLELNVSYILVNGEFFDTYGYYSLHGAKIGTLMGNLTGNLATQVYKDGGIVVYSLP